jgi:transposase InsO family protein
MTVVAAVQPASRSKCSAKTRNSVANSINAILATDELIETRARDRPLPAKWSRRVFSFRFYEGKIRADSGLRDRPGDDARALGCFYGAAVMHRLRAMGIRDKPIAPRSPWQNGFAERLIGSIRRECVDHVVALGEAHLRKILQAYARYYNDLRTHRSLDKDAPHSRPVQRIGRITSHALVGGLHHHYCRI